ncbi:right-handed parallel beta-helix repeat-containing protein [Methanophagales archaeon]|nr:MAG: right-handed parallel beta-helix repeat-containing protein [Methanophagales archaeon]
MSGFTIERATGYYLSPGGVYYYKSGIYVYESDNCRFFDNVFMGNNYGMIIHTGSDNTIVRDNIFRNNLKYGIWIDGGSGSRICSNYIHDNPYGIYIQSSLNNHINYNRICGNTNYGVYSDCGVDAEFNWWGDASGPSGAGSGTGDAVSANVDYDPWLGAPLELSAVHHESLGAGTHSGCLSGSGYQGNLKYHRRNRYIHC